MTPLSACHLPCSSEEQVQSSRKNGEKNGSAGDRGRPFRGQWCTFSWPSGRWKERSGLFRTGSLTSEGANVGSHYSGCIPDHVTHIFPPSGGCLCHRAGSASTTATTGLLMVCLCPAHANLSLFFLSFFLSPTYGVGSSGPKQVYL